MRKIEGILPLNSFDANVLEGMFNIRQAVFGFNSCAETSTQFGRPKGLCPQYEYVHLSFNRISTISILWIDIFTLYDIKWHQLFQKPCCASARETSNGPLKRLQPLRRYVLLFQGWPYVANPSNKLPLYT